MTVAQRSSAHDLIAAKGQAVTLTRQAAGAYDPATGAAAITTSTQAGKGVILPLSPMRKNGDSIVEGDQAMLLSGLNSAGAALTAPKVSDTVTDSNSKVWTLIGIEPLAPAGLSIIYDCVIRGVD